MSQKSLYFRRGDAEMRELTKVVAVVLVAIALVALGFTLKQAPAPIGTTQANAASTSPARGTVVGHWTRETGHPWQSLLEMEVKPDGTGTFGKKSSFQWRNQGSGFLATDYTIAEWTTKGDRTVNLPDFTAELGDDDLLKISGIGGSYDGFWKRFVPANAGQENGRA